MEQVSAPAPAARAEETSAEAGKPGAPPDSLAPVEVAPAEATPPEIMAPEAAAAEAPPPEAISLDVAGLPNVAPLEPAAPADVAPETPVPLALALAPALEAGPDKFFLDQDELTPPPTFSPRSVYVDEEVLKPAPAPPAECPSCAEPVGTAARCEHCGSAHRAGKYRVVRVVSQGPHGRVYEAVGPGGERVALKELLFALVPDAATLDAFDREANLLRDLTHPQIPRLVDAFHEGSGVHTRCYLAQELVEGQRLLEVIAHEPLTSEEARRLGKQILRVLETLHGRDPPVLHRDIKPANLILRPDGMVVLVDFGSARLLPRGVTHGATLVGTFGYMPPEQLGGTVDESCDLYALGATLMHALTGRPPEEMTRDGLRLDVDRHLEGVDPKLKKVIKRLVAPNRALRYRDAHEALVALRGNERSRTLAAAAAAAFIAAVGVTVAWPRLVGQPAPEVERRRIVEREPPAAPRERGSRPRAPVTEWGWIGPPTQARFLTSPLEEVWNLSSSAGKSTRRLDPGTGGIYVVTQQSGAEVWLDGERQDRLTPIDLNYFMQVPPGRHQVRVVQFGVTGTMDVQVFPGQMVGVHGQLERSLQAGLALASQGPGVPVWLDGIDTGRVTPIPPAHPLLLSPGIHSISFGRDEPRLGPFTIRVERGRLYMVTNIPAR